MTTWTTGEVAEKCGLTEHTLRWYERIGLLDRIARVSGGRRRYTERDLDWIALLTRLRTTGMPVSEMQRYASLVRDGSAELERLQILEEHRDRVRASMQAQQECLEVLDGKIKIYRRAIRAAHKE